MAEMGSGLKRLIKGLRLRLQLRAIDKLRIDPSRDMKLSVLNANWEGMSLRSSIFI